MFAKLFKKSLIVVIGTSVFGGTAVSQDFQLNFKPENPEEVLAVKWEDLMSQADLAAILMHRLFPTMVTVGTINLVRIVR